MRRINMTNRGRAGSVLRLAMLLCIMQTNTAMTGTVDEKNGGAITSNRATSGYYFVDNDGHGRGVISFAGDQNPNSFYLVSP
jgi:hypothetical protein